MPYLFDAIFIITSSTCWHDEDVPCTKRFTVAVNMNGITKGSPTPRRLSPLSPSCRGRWCVGLVFLCQLQSIHSPQATVNPFEKWNLIGVASVLLSWSGCLARATNRISPLLLSSIQSHKCAAIHRAYSTIPPTRGPRLIVGVVRWQIYFSCVNLKLVSVHPPFKTCSWFTDSYLFLHVKT